MFWEILPKKLPIKFSAYCEENMIENDLLEKVREISPLVHHLTNWVTIYDCASITRAFGALPVMAHAKEECYAMAMLSSSLVLNIGTITSSMLDSMILAGKGANQMGIPIVLDAVGVGSTKYREDAVLRILDEVKISVIKGNASEIARLAGKKVKTRGVEASSVNFDLTEIAKKLAKERKMAVVITGKEDIVADKNRTYLVHNGDKMMGAVVGTGCMATSVIGAFAAIEKDYGFAASTALSCFGVAGELAGKKSSGPSSFKTFLIDEAYNLTSEKIREMEKIEIL